MENYHQSQEIDNEAERLRLISLTGNLATKSAFAALLDAGFSPATILDTGCGTGDAFEIIHQSFPAAKVIGIDQSAKAVEVARAKGIASKVIVGDIATLSSNGEVQQEGPFDLVFVRNTLLHIPNTGTILEELKRVAASKGVVLAIESDWGAASANWPDFDIFKQAMMAAMRDHNINPTLGQSLEQLFTEAGFLNVTKTTNEYKTESSDEGWKVLEYLLDVSSVFITPYLQKLGVESVDSMKDKLRQAQRPGNYFNTPAWVTVVGNKPAS